MSTHSTATPSTTTWQARLKGLVTGIFFVAVGYWLTSHGVHVFIGRYRQPVFSYSFIAGGSVVILVSAAPSWLIIKMTAIKKYRPYQAVSHAHGNSINRAAN